MANKIMLKKRILSKMPLLASSLIIFFLTTQNGFSQTTAKEIYKKNSSTIVLIKTNTGGGTGFLVSPTGLIATAYHVIDGVSSVAIKVQSGEVFNDVALVAKDEGSDIAILKINSQDTPYIEFNNNEITPGDQVIVLGNPLALEELEVSISTGILSGNRKLANGTRILQITAPISPGNSGGPVFSDDGKVIGMISFKITKGEALNFAIHSIHIQQLLKQVSSEILASWSNKAGKIFSQENSLDLPIKKSPFNLTGKWNLEYSGSSDTLKIIDDGRNIEIWRYDPYVGNYKAYVVEWNDGFILGINSKSTLRIIIKPINENYLIWDYFDLKPEESKEQTTKIVQKKLSKLTIKKNSGKITRYQ